MNSLSINKDDLIQMTFLNMGQGRIDDHPVHMHGHAFMVVKVGYDIAATWYNDGILEYSSPLYHIRYISIQP
jgi:hypothetical protein